jgi:hypothetical protein
VGDSAWDDAGYSRRGVLEKIEWEQPAKEMALFWQEEVQVLEQVL